MERSTQLPALGAPGGKGRAPPAGVVNLRAAIPDLIAALVSSLTWSCSASELPARSERELGAAAVLCPLRALSVVPAERDPLSQHRPPSVECSDLTGWYIEGEQLEIDTGRCNYLALAAPAAVSAPRGATLTAELRHFDLTAPEPAQVHVAILIESGVLWEQNISVPGQANVVDIELELPTDIDEGDTVGLHLHNHGQNNYQFGPLHVSATLLP